MKSKRKQQIRRESFDLSSSVPGDQQLTLFFEVSLAVRGQTLDKESTPSPFIRYQPSTSLLSLLLLRPAVTMSNNQPPTQAATPMQLLHLVQPPLHFLEHRFRIVHQAGVQLLLRCDASDDAPLKEFFLLMTEEFGKCVEVTEVLGCYGGCLEVFGGSVGRREGAL